VCTEFDVTQLADHLIGSVTYLCAAAGGEPGAGPVTSPLEARVATAAQATLEAWHVRGLDGTVKVGPHEMPAGAALGILSIEFLVHAWDFAQATGQQVAVSDEVAQHVLGLARQIITPKPGRRKLRRPDRGRSGRRPARPAHRLHRPNQYPVGGISYARTHLIHAGHAELGGPADQRPGRGQGVLRRAVRLDLRRPAHGRRAGVLDGHAPRPPGRRDLPAAAEMAAAGAPPMWNTYLAVDSVDDATAKVEAAGGKVAMAPFDVMDAGRMSFVMDPSGAPVALWQANQHIGATLVNEPGTLNWNELVTSDPGATRFYADVTGLTAETWTWARAPYTVFKAGDAMVGGTTAPQMPGTPSHWHVYFGTDDADATAAKAAELGGSVVVPPFDTPVGRIAVLSDPQGAMFSVIKNAPRPSHADAQAQRGRQGVLQVDPLRDHGTGLTPHHAARP
jgi:uncharacterized protein (TIGR03086 family)